MELMKAKDKKRAGSGMKVGLLLGAALGEDGRAGARPDLFNRTQRQKVVVPHLKALAGLGPSKTQHRR